MAELLEGAKSPDFDLPGGAGAPRRLSELRGQPVVVYFYPKDDTPACTREALDFSAALAEFAALGVAVIGISPDPARSHERFARKHDLRLGLLADPDRQVIGRYGVWVEKSMFGRAYMGVERATFLIDAAGRIARVWRRVRVAGHVEEVLTAARELANPAAKAKKPSRKEGKN